MTQSKSTPIGNLGLHFANEIKGALSPLLLIKKVSSLCVLLVMDDNLYDEFGVYLGPDLDDEDVLSDHELEDVEAGITADAAGGSRMDIGACPVCQMLP